MIKRLLLLVMLVHLGACDSEYISKKREGMTWFSQDNETKEAQEEKNGDD